jgi:endonuclease/exonuclease/phosphatase (EEP) superfamily protein YafD
MLEELTEAEQAALGAAGLDKLLPYHVSDPQGAALGTGLWSRYPLSEQTKRGDFSFAFVTARVAIPGVAHPPLAVAAHMAGPYPDSADWLKDMAHLPSVLSSLADSASTLVGGDFNATPDVVQFRHLLRDGYADAADQAGAGVTATWPTDQWYGPVIAIDHVLTRHAVATSADTLSIANTDHRALLVKVAVPRS